METSLDAILARIRGGQTVSCYLLYGDEDYRIADSLRQLVDCLLPGGRNDLNLMRIDGERGDVEAIVEAVLTPSLLGERKVVLVQDTRLFLSKKSGTQLIQSVQEHLAQEPRRAVQAFLSFLDAAGLALDDLRDGGWQKIPEETWQHLLDGESPRDVGSWLPRVIALCDETPLPGRPPSANTERLEEALAGTLPGGNCLVLTAQAVDRRKKLFKLIAEMGGAIACEKPKKEGDQRAAFIELAREMAAGAGKKISPQALEILGIKTGYDLTASASEMRKLFVWTETRAAIEKEDVEAVVPKSKEETVFALVGALVSKDVNLTLGTLRYLRDQGVHPLQIVAMIARELRLLLQAKMLMESKAVAPVTADTGYAKFQSAVYPQVREKSPFPGKRGSTLAGLHPFVMYNVFRSAGKFSFDDIYGHFHRLAAFDVAVKSTGIDPDRALERIVIDMCGGRS